MHLDFRGYSTQYVTSYWPASVKSNYEFIFVRVDDDRKAIDYTVAMTKNEASINNRLLALGWGQYRSGVESKFVLHHPNGRSRIFILNKDQYKIFRNAIITNKLEFELDMSGNQLTNMALPAPGKPVFIVWNMSTSSLVGTAPTKADALTAAQELSRKNPIHTFLICEPTTKIFQPANVTVEAVTLD